MVKSFSRGHEIYFLNGQWRYSDNKKLLSNIRECKRCGKKPTKEGHDACLGKLNNVSSACCGHGVDEKINIIKSKESK